MVKLLYSKRFTIHGALFSNPSYHFSRRFEAPRSINLKMESEFYTFGPYKIHSKEVFYSSELSYAMVNLRPLLPGHILLCSRLFVGFHCIMWLKCSS